jgi:diaminopimelate decarboxylase
VRAAQLPNLEVVGVDCHRLATDHPRAVPRRPRPPAGAGRPPGECGIYLRHIDLGGGVGVRYRDEEPPLVADYIKAVRERVGGRDLALVFEPGRFIVANAGVLLTRSNTSSTPNTRTSPSSTRR